MLYKLGIRMELYKLIYYLFDNVKNLSITNGNKNVVKYRNHEFLFQISLISGAA